ncbi:hypothetical protein MSAN_01624600 [Mycena sanguinolenta]|uniref:Uncharacterized protein n=1 Tax=Mycena sanguinolenta TaxID=230812 RepID=A0A8H6XYH1_9AGAR|nr:hypothetical protein MSAN_01624600 [Mycena sanguinolenta]
MLTGSDKALIRFLSNADVTTAEIRAEFGWAPETINKYKRESGREDKRYITPNFARILRDIQSGRKKDDSDHSVKSKATPKRGRGRPRRSTGSQSSAARKTRFSIREKGTGKSSRAESVEAPSCTAQQDSDSDEPVAPIPAADNKDFLVVKDFALNAGLDPVPKSCSKIQGPRLSRSCVRWQRWGKKKLRRLFGMSSSR